MRTLTVVLLVLTAGGSMPGAQDAIRVDYCVLARYPEQYAEKQVVVRAVLTELRGGEWALDSSECYRPILLSLPQEVAPQPDFALESTRSLELLFEAQRDRRLFFEADFVGRFDWAGPASAHLGGRPKQSFGKSQMTMRLVLRDVEAPRTYRVPRR